MNKGRILAVDDEQNIRRLIDNEFTLEGYEVTTAHSGEEGLQILQHQPFDLVLLDIKLPKLNGVETLRRLKQIAPATEVIMITGYGDLETAVESMKLGARDYVTKPFKLDELLALVKQALQENGRSRPETPRRPHTGGRDSTGFVLCPSRSMQGVYNWLERISGTDCTVLIQGETGVGKDVLAYQIHRTGERREGPFVTVDCGLLNQNLVESELYGHRKGAFSGAAEDKVGLVEKSHNGTLFLDEIGNIDLELQKKFLRFLETGRFRRVGDTKEIEVDTRIILATNMDLQKAMQRGDLREDLFYRMDVMQVHIPPLRERPMDVECLAKHFVKTFRNRSGPGKISSEAVKRLQDYHWPGNVRELRSVINKAMILAESDILLADDLPAHLALSRKLSVCCPKTLEDVEKEHILTVLEETGGNQSRASEILGINRKTLYKKIQKHGLFS
jgi:DNA-binding NtrC family response regulator